MSTCLYCGKPPGMDHHHVCPNRDPRTAQRPLTEEQRRERDAAERERAERRPRVLRSFQPRADVWAAATRAREEP